MEQTLNFDLCSGVKTLVKDYAQLDDAYLVAHIDKDSLTEHIASDTVMRVDGMTILLLKKGTVKLDINLDSFEARSPSVCVLHPASRMLFRPEEAGTPDCYLLFMSQRFLQNININLSAFNFPVMIEKPSPVVDITTREFELLERYFGLLAQNARDAVTGQLTASVGSSLVSAVIYELAKIQYRRINTGDSSTGGRQRSARAGYVHDFIKLVRAHYAVERSVAFYASKLFISPKYLSLIVKETTGKSAARWIDEFVLMEAKNMLRYSGKNIQQVAYALNFSNQSSFGKYFKHLTGMSPTQFQNR